MTLSSSTSRVSRAQGRSLQRPGSLQSRKYKRIPSPWHSARSKRRPRARPSFQKPSWEAVGTAVSASTSLYFTQHFNFVPWNRSRSSTLHVSVSLLVGHTINGWLQTSTSWVTVKTVKTHGPKLLGDEMGWTSINPSYIPAPWWSLPRFWAPHEASAVAGGSVFGRCCRRVPQESPGHHFPRNCRFGVCRYAPMGQTYLTMVHWLKPYCPSFMDITDIVYSLLVVSAHIPINIPLNSMKSSFSTVKSPLWLGNTQHSWRWRREAPSHRSSTQSPESNVGWSMGKAKGLGYRYFWWIFMIIIQLLEPSADEYWW